MGYKQILDKHGNSWYSGLMKDQSGQQADESRRAEEAARLLREAAALVEQGRAPEALALQEQAAALLHAPTKTETPITREAAASPQARPSRAEMLGTIGRSARQDVVDALNDLGVPSSPRAIADYARARFGTKLEPRLFASLRRDERRTWESPRSHRPVYVVQALSAASPGRLLAVRGKLALSDWPLEVRLTGPWSERVDHLKATVNVARQVQWLRASKPEEADRVAAVLARFAATVPDATDSVAAVDPDRVIRAARAELELLGTADDEWRRETAAAAREAVALDEQLWGTGLPRLVGSSE